MMNKISKRIVERLLGKGIIIKSDYDIYLFGIEQLLSIILNLLTTILIGCLFGIVWQAILFVGAFMILRSYAGGYHALTPVRCYILTIVTIIVSLSAIKYFEIDMVVLISLLIMTSVVILVLAPVDTENKPIDEIEYIYYRKKTMIVWGVEVIIALLCVAVDFLEEMKCIVCAQVVLSVVLLCERIRKKEKINL